MNNFWKSTRFNKFFFNYYDSIVNNINCTYSWRCPPHHVKQFYRNNLSKNHLEIGPGTSYFIKNTQFDTLHLMDVNHDVLHFSATKMKNNSKYIYKIDHNIFVPDSPPIFLKDIHSIGVNYVLHCVPHKLSDSIYFLTKNIRTNTTYTLFGTTVVPQSTQNILAYSQIRLLNRYGIFHNRNHSVDDLSLYLSKNYYNRYTLHQIGNTLFFTVLVDNKYI